MGESYAGRGDLGYGQQRGFALRFFGQQSEQNERDRAADKSAHKRQSAELEFAGIDKVVDGLKKKRRA